MLDRQARVAARAYYIWERDGKPNDRDIAYWLQAELELQAEGSRAKRRGRIRNWPSDSAGRRPDPAP
jgi:Protein of unknown function (DUF2934)